MKSIIVILMLLIGNSTNAQSYFKISGKKEVMQYDSKNELAKSKVGDSLYLEVRDINSFYVLTLTNSDTKKVDTLATCLYRKNGSKEDVTVKQESPRGVVNVSVKADVVDAVNENCLEKFLNRFYK